MPSVTLVLIVHDHQPIGNFDGVFRDAYAASYEPFLGFLESRPAMRLGLHTSGPLLQWIALHEPSYLERLRRLVERGQVELVGGGFFEPILPAIPEPDRRGQIETMADWLELELGRRPRGLWLTERVWEPSLASTLKRSGVAWTAVDDAHFVAAGLERDTLWGHYLTEDQGEPVSVFPIHRELRYRVPFEHPGRTVEFLRGVAEGGPGRIAVLGDDGEKFGVWPGTRALVWDERWLERWADALAAEPWIEVRTPSEALDAHPSRGLVYLPTASYHEMQEWALPPAAQDRYHRAAETLKPVFGEDAHDLLRGGHWRNFQARYPESNRLHKRALRASRRLWREPHERDASWLDARTHLWRAQCNCPYWHGVFGGLYLPHLRSAVYRDLIAAERALSDDTSHVERGDLDLDGHEDALLETPRWAAWVSARGGRLWAFDDRVAGVNYIDTLARRPEAYHDRLREAGVGGGEGHSIHAAVRVKDPGLAAAALSYDRHGRDAFVDAWREPPLPGPAELDADGAKAWAEREFSLGATADTVTAEAPEGDTPALVKRYRATSEGTLEVEYALSAARPRHGTLRVEVNLGLHVPRAEDRWVEVNGERADPPNFGDAARHERVTRLAFVDAWAERRLELSLDREASVERAPIETVSLSEAGAERVFQGIGLRFAIDARVGADEPWRLRFRLSPVHAEAHA